MATTTPTQPRTVSLPIGAVVAGKDVDGLVFCACGAQILVTRGSLVFSHACRPEPRQ